MLEKQESYSKIEVLESGQVQLRKTTKVLDDGKSFTISPQKRSNSLRRYIGFTR
jgi:hypothetical protein